MERRMLLLASSPTTLVDEAFFMVETTDGALALVQAIKKV
jgi:hypothetical protein